MTPKSLFTLESFSSGYNYTTETPRVGKPHVWGRAHSGTDLCQLQYQCAHAVRKAFSPDKAPQQAMPQLWAASMCRVPALGLCSWPWQAARGASCPGLGVNSSETCPACQSLLTRATWQGEKWSEEVFIAPFSQMLTCAFFPSGILPCQGLCSARC